MTDLLTQLRGYGEQLEAQMAVLEPEDVRLVRIGTGAVRAVMDREPPHRRRWLIAAAAGLAVVVAVVLAVLLWPRSGDPAPFINQGSTIPQTTVTVPTTLTPSTTATGMAATEDGWEIVLPGYDPLVALSADEAWVGDGLWHLDGDRTSRLPLPADLPRVDDLVVTPDGTLWVMGGANGLFSFDGTEWIRRFDGTVGAVTVAPDGTVWIGGSPCRDWDTWGRAPFVMARWDGESFTRVDPWQEVTSQEDFSYGGLKTVMAATTGGEVWIASLGYLASDLMRYDGQTLETVQIGDFQDSWPDNAAGPVGVFDIEAAPNGGIWIGGFDFRRPDRVVLARFDGAEWTVYDWPFADPSPGGEPFYFDLAFGPDGTLWVSFPGGLGSYDGATWSLRVVSRTWETHPGPVDVAPDGTVWYSDPDGLHTLTP